MCFFLFWKYNFFARFLHTQKIEKAFKDNWVVFLIPHKILFTIMIFFLSLNEIEFFNFAGKTTNHYFTLLFYVRSYMLCLKNNDYVISNDCAYILILKIILMVYHGMHIKCMHEIVIAYKIEQK